MKGKTILITGGSGGIGAAVASAFVDVGASVIITDIKPPRKSSDQLLFLQADASSEKEVKQVLEHIGREYGGIDILFNNSGVWIPGKTTLQFDGEEFDKVLKINFKSAMWFVKYGIPRMPKKETSCIITSS
jgi:NAD(P)-dependent dehydrogenase (short-subunit alcohol dehydrogenase family)